MYIDGRIATIESVSIGPSTGPAHANHLVRIPRPFALGIPPKVCLSVCITCIYLRVPTHTGMIICGRAQRNSRRISVPLAASLPPFDVDNASQERVDNLMATHFHTDVDSEADK